MRHVSVCRLTTLMLSTSFFLLKLYPSVYEQWKWEVSSRRRWAFCQSYLNSSWLWGCLSQLSISSQPEFSVFCRWQLSSFRKFCWTMWAYRTYVPLRRDSSQWVLFSATWSTYWPKPHLSGFWNISYDAIFGCLTIQGILKLLSISSDYLMSRFFLIMRTGWLYYIEWFLGNF